jgi:hypothetical protein
MRIAAAFKSLEPRAKVVERTVLKDTYATKESILKEAKRLVTQMHEKDLLVIYFAGYSFSVPDRHDVYVAPSDVTLTNRTRVSLISTISVKDHLAPLAGEYRKVLLIADSGEVGDAQLGDIAMQYPGFSVLSAAREDEEALEVETKMLHGSPFARALVDSLEGDIPDLDGDGLISVDELYIYLYQKSLEVQQLTTQRRFQHASLFGAMTHHMMISQGSSSGQKIEVGEKLVGLRAGTNDVKINGETTTITIDPGSSIVTLGRADINFLRNGLNVIDSVYGQFLYWIEEGKLLNFQQPYKSSYAIIVAIDDYDRSSDPEHRGPTGFYQLSGMVDRANELAEALVSVGFPRNNIKLMFNIEATSSQIEQTMRKFWSGEEHADADRLFFYFGGHGQGYEVRPGHPEGVRLITYDYDSKRPSSTTFDARELAEGQSRNIAAHHVMYALDVCQAGLAVYRHLGGDESRDKDFGRLSVIRADVGPIARNILVAGTEEEDALWDNGGVFTEALIHGLRGDAERGGIGLITFEDLEAYVRNRVIAKAAKTQVRQEPVGKVLDEYGDGRMVFILNSGKPAPELQQPSKEPPMER